MRFPIHFMGFSWILRPKGRSDLAPGAELTAHFIRLALRGHATRTGACKISLSAIGRAASGTTKALKLHDI